MCGSRACVYTRHTRRLDSVGHTPHKPLLHTRTRLSFNYNTLTSGAGSHAYPLVPEIVPLWALMVFCFAAPYSLYIVYWLFAARSLHDLHHSMLGTAESISLTVLCTQSLKVRGATLAVSYVAEECVA